MRSEPDVVIECRPSACAGCGEALPETGGRRVGRSQVVELPPVTPVVIEGWQYAMTCGSCGTQTPGTYPAGLEPRRTFGPRIEALLSYLHERHHVGYERLVEVCRDVFGLAISQGGVENALARVSGVHKVEMLNGDAGAKDYVTAALRPKDGYDVREEAARTVIQNGWPLREIRLEHATLEEFFVQVTANQAMATTAEAKV